MSCPLARARDVLHAIDCAEQLRDWNPPLAVRLAHAGYTVAEARDRGSSMLARGGGAPGGRRRDRSKTKAARAARRRNR